MGVAEEFTPASMQSTDRESNTVRINAMTDSTKISLSSLTTEARNPRTSSLDNLNSLELVKLINSEDEKVAKAVADVADSIAEAIDIIADRLSHGGRLVYVGAGTSGRLGVLDAVECPPTFNTSPELVVGVMAGGTQGLLKAVEGAEDSRQQGEEDLKDLQLNARDVVVGIAASGRTPYVIGAVDYARRTGAYAIGFYCNRDAELKSHVDLSINPEVGPEVLSGSTRLKAGTATKLVLNMLSTGAMVRMGKTYSNLMVDVRATNEKLNERAGRIIEAITACSNAEARALLRQCDGELKTAVLVYTFDIEPELARLRLRDVNGHLRSAMECESNGEEGTET